MGDETTTDRPTYKVVQVRAGDLKIGDVIVRQRRQAIGPASRWIDVHHEIKSVRAYPDATPPKVVLTFVGVDGTLQLNKVELVDAQVESGRVS